MVDEGATGSVFSCPGVAQSLWVEAHEPTWARGRAGLWRL